MHRDIPTWWANMNVALVMQKILFWLMASHTIYFIFPHANTYICTYEPAYVSMYHHHLRLTYIIPTYTEKNHPCIGRRYFIWTISWREWFFTAQCTVFFRNLSSSYSTIPCYRDLGFHDQQTTKTFILYGEVDISGKEKKNTTIYL